MTSLTALWWPSRKVAVVGLGCAKLSTAPSSFAAMRYVWIIDGAPSGPGYEAGTADARVLVVYARIWSLIDHAAWLSCLGGPRAWPIRAPAR